MKAESILITISPESESKPVDLSNAKELIIEKLEENSDNQETLMHHIILFTNSDISRAPKAMMLKPIKYDVSDFNQFRIKNINPRFSLTILYSKLSDDINPDDYDYSKMEHL